MSDYLVDNRAVPHEQFVRRALDPACSVVVEACAGGGKTWLLVGRILRCLLAGVAPGQILAITFTRRAAQEMRERLFADLAALARGSPEQITALLCERGMEAHAARAAVPLALDLYERVATACSPVAIDTFHGWFWRLVRAAPLQAGAGYGLNLLEQPEALLDEAWADWCRTLLDPARAAARRDYEQLAALVGDAGAESLLRTFVQRRTDWWSFSSSGAGDPVQRACEPMRAQLLALAGQDQRHPGAALDEAPLFDQVVKARDLSGEPGLGLRFVLAGALDLHPHSGPAFVARRR